MKSPAPTNPKTFLERDNWMRAVNASGEPQGARCLAFAIALHLNVKAGRCDPGHVTLSKEAGISERSVRRFIALLERDGWLATKRGGRGHNSSYVLVRPASALADQDTCHMTGQVGSHDRPTGGRQKERKLSPFGRESVCSASLIPTGAHLTVRQEVEEERKEASGSPREGKEEKTEPVQLVLLEPEPVADLKFQFERLCEVWQKPDGIDRRKALKAFEAVCSEYLDPEDAVLDSAAAWVATVEPRYLPRLETWLAHGAWLKDPPARRLNGHRKPTCSEVAMELSRRYYAEGR